MIPLIVAFACGWIFSAAFYPTPIPPIKPRVGFSVHGLTMIKGGRA